MASTSTTVTSVDCEGACCCRCTWCKGVGYWSSYDIIFPVSDGEVRCIAGVRTFVAGASDVIQACISGNTFTITPTVPFKFGSEGGTGDCEWDASICPVEGGFSGGLRFILRDGLGTLQIPYSGVCVPGVLYNVIDFDCRTGGTISGDPTVDCISACANNPHFPSNITIVPSAGATWQQCGQNSDGTTYEEAPPPLLMSPTMTTTRNPTAKKSLDVIPRPDRCDSYNGRDKFRTGCNGWLCAGKCELGIKECMPGGFCQACDKYAVDPDFIGQGPAGWAK